MIKKLYALALEKCAVESADNPMNQELLLGGHFYLMVLKVSVLDKCYQLLINFGNFVASCSNLIEWQHFL